MNTLTAQRPVRPAGFRIARAALRDEALSRAVSPAPRIRPSGHDLLVTNPRPDLMPDARLWRMLEVP